MSILHVDNVTHGFGDRTLFKDISFRLLNNEHVGLVGANGVGKSTLISLITGQLIPDEGKIEWAPRVKVGYLDQHAKLTKGNSVRHILKSAFQSLYDLEKQLFHISDTISTSSEDEMEQLLDRMGNIQEELDRNDFYTLDTKIDEVAQGLGITAIGLGRDVEELSGGQRTKILLAKLLLEQPNVLLLDEPTNYLDAEHISWLVSYLKSYPHSFILISHDTNFMNKVVNRIYHIEYTKLTRYIGNYEEYLKQYEFQKMQYMQQYNRQQEQIKKMEDFIAKNIVRASTTSRAQSRRKQLEKIERLEKPIKQAKPSYFFLESKASEKKVLSCDQLVIGYDRPLLPSLSLTLERGQKIAITGCNGVGKSTLLRTLMGELAPLAGSIKRAEQLYPAYFQQEVHHSGEKTAIDEVWDVYPHLSQKEVRSYLARCGLKSEHILQKMSALSGGEQAKVRLCKLMLSESNIMLLDEPTNHLDVLSKEALRQALMNYGGTILLVCHEPEFYKGWITKTWNVEQWATNQSKAK